MRAPEQDLRVFDRRGFVGQAFLGDRQVVQPICVAFAIAVRLDNFET